MVREITFQLTSSSSSELKGTTGGRSARGTTGTLVSKVTQFRTEPEALGTRMELNSKKNKGHLSLRSPCLTVSLCALDERTSFNMCCRCPILK